jgi:hypothetical protein
MLLMQCVDSVLMLLRSMVTVALVLGYFLIQLAAQLRHPGNPLIENLCQILFAVLYLFGDFNELYRTFLR